MSSKSAKMSLTNYFAKLCEKQNEIFCHTLSPFMSEKKYRNGGNITTNENGATMKDTFRVSEIFNDFFVNIATNIGFYDDVISASDAIRRHDQHPSAKRIKAYYHGKIKNFDFHVVDTETVMQMIKIINPRRATGCENIPGKLIRIALGETSIPIRSPLNASITAKSFPSIMKYADISPCFMDEDNLFKRKTYRPVGVLIVLSKLYERVLNNEMVDHFRNLFNIVLSAFRKLKLIKYHKTGDAFIDLSKAFDCLPHALLIATLNAFGLSTAARELMIFLWFSASIRGCNEWIYQIVEVHGNYWITGTQDSILGPFFPMLLWMICSFSWRDVIYVITLMTTYNKTWSTIVRMRSSGSQTMNGRKAKEGTPGLRHVAWQTILGMGSISRYYVQIIICITKHNKDKSYTTVTWRTAHMK